MLEPESRTRVLVHVLCCCGALALSSYGALPLLLRTTSTTLISSSRRAHSQYLRSRRRCCCCLDEEGLPVVAAVEHCVGVHVEGALLLLSGCALPSCPSRHRASSSQKMLAFCSGRPSYLSDQVGCRPTVAVAQQGRQ